MIPMIIRSPTCASKSLGMRNRVFRFPRSRASTEVPHSPPAAQAPQDVLRSMASSAQRPSMPTTVAVSSSLPEDAWSTASGVLLLPLNSRIIVFLYAGITVEVCQGRYHG